MKFSYFFLLLLLTISEWGIAQDSLSRRKPMYKVSFTDSALNQTKGYLLNLSDSAMKITTLPIKFGEQPSAGTSIMDVRYNQVTELELKRRGGAGRGAWKGAVAGFLIGAICGLISGTDPPCQKVDPATDFYGLGAIGEGFCNAFRMTAGEKALAYGVLAGAAGTGVGALTGALVKKKFIIGRNKERFNEMRVNVLNKAYGSN
jgi:hypothetical protein